MFGSAEFIKFGQQVVADYFNKRRALPNAQELKAEGVYVVWYCKTLQNRSVPTCPSSETTLTAV